MPTDTSDTPGMVQHAAHGGRMREGLAQIAVAQIGMRIELQDHQVLVALGERADGAGRQRMLAAQHEGKLARVEHAADQAGKLIQRRRQRLGDGRLRDSAATP